MSIPDLELAMQVHKQMEASARLASEGLWTQTNGTIDGQPFTIVIAVGPGAASLLRVINAVGVTDPRSTMADDE